MNWPYEIQLGWRYTRQGRTGRRNGFVSVISAISVLGIALGVAALIVVLSVMNGFQKEVRDRMLSVVAHVEVFAVGQAWTDWRSRAAQFVSHPEVLAAAPFVAAQALVARGDDMVGTVVRGIEPLEEGKVTQLSSQVTEGSLERLVPGNWGILLGEELARSLHVKQGEKVTLMAPGGQLTPAGLVPRLKQLTVVGTFRSGHHQYDSALALMHVEDAAKLFRIEGISGIQLRLKDLHQAREVAFQLHAQFSPWVEVRDWTSTNQQWFTAVQIEKRLMAIILTLIVAVASFNLVSTLVMTVTEKRADIAILRTLGATPASVMAVFVVQGAMAGMIGTFLGLGAGLWCAYEIDSVVRTIEALLQTQLLDARVYLISHMPTDPQSADIVPIALVSLGMSFLATLYPSWRASRLQPAQALRYE